jgi:hypothetical protein
VLRSFPLLLFVVILYNLLAASHGFAPKGTDDLLHMGVTVPMFSGEPWTFSMGDLVVVVGLGLLFVEVVKATRTTAIEVINHALSMLVFIVALVEFIVLPAFATSPFFFIVLMALFDIVAGFTISIVAAKRDFGTSGGIIGTN